MRCRARTQFSNDMHASSPSYDVKNRAMKTRLSIGVLLLLTALGCSTHSFAAAASSRGTQGYLGVDLRDVTDDEITQLKLKEARGAEVISVDHDGPACKAGLQLHDVILQMNGTVIEGEEQLRRMLRETPAGRQVTFIVSHDGQQHTITTQLANREEVERQAWEQHYTVPEPDSDSSAYIHAGSGFFKSSPSSAAAPTGAVKGTHSLLGTSIIISASYTGAKLEVMGPQLAEFFGAQGAAGLLVRSVDPNSPAEHSGLKAGDVVVKINSVPVTAASEWTKTIHENRGKPVSLLVLRDKKEQALTLTPDAHKRSSLEPPSDLEGFFGWSDDAQQTRATLAQLEPMFNQLAEQFEALSEGVAQPIQPVGFTPEAQQLMARMEAVAVNPRLQMQFERQLEEARRELHAAAEAARRQLDSPVLQHQMD